MKILKYLTAVTAIMFIASSCEKNVENPVLKSSDLTVYFYGNGGNSQGLAWEGFDVMVGEPFDVSLMISPSEGTDVKWTDDDGTVINTTLDYAYTAQKEGVEIKRFFATNQTVVKELAFRFFGRVEGEYSKMADNGIPAFKNIFFPNDEVVSTSTKIEFDMVGL